MTHIQRLFVLALVVIATTQTNVDAGMVTYTFSGTIDVSDSASSTDPWGLGLGTSGHTFSVSATFDNQNYGIQTDSLGDFIEANASNGFVSGTMTLNGATSNLHAPGITVYDDFTSTTIPGHDYVRLGGRATFNGADDIFSLRITLDPGTYGFSAGTAPLPILNVDVADFILFASSSGDSGYTFATTALTTESTPCVPEPSSCVLLGLGCLTMLGVRSRRRMARPDRTGGRAEEVVC